MESTIMSITHLPMVGGGSHYVLRFSTTDDVIELYSYNHIEQNNWYIGLYIDEDFPYKYMLVMNLEDASEEDLFQESLVWEYNIPFYLFIAVQKYMKNATLLGYFEKQYGIELQY